MKLKFLATLAPTLLVASLLAAPLTAASSAPAPQSKPRPTPAASGETRTDAAAKESAPASDDAARAEAQRRQTAIGLLVREIGRARFFRRPSYSARVLTEAADALWPVSLYEHVAEKALRDAWAYTGRDLDDEIKSRTAERERVVAAHELRTELRSDILAVAQRRKPSLIDELLSTIEQKDEDARDAHNLPIAFGTGSLRQQQLASAALRLAASDPARAAELAAGSLDFGMPQELQGIFRELAVSGPTHARELFRKAVAAYVADQSVNIYDAVFVASYLRAAREPESDAALVRSFLDAALERMLRLRRQHLEAGNRSEGQRSAMLMTLGYLQPHFQTYHPERLNELTVLAQQLRHELPAEQFEEDALNLTSPDSPNAPENILSRAASEKNEGRRDELYLQAALKFVAEKKFERALDAALSARDRARRDPFVNYIRHQHASHLAAAGELDQAALLIEKIEDPELRADATVAHAAAARRKKDLVSARYALDQSVKALGNQPGSGAHARAYLWLASAYALFDAERGFELMPAAVRAANAAGQELQELRPGRRIIHVNERVREAIQTGGGGAGDFRAGFRALARADFQRAAQIAELFENPLFRGLAVVSSAASVLAEKPKAPKESAPRKPAALPGEKPAREKPSHD